MNPSPRFLPILVTTLTLVTPHGFSETPEPEALPLLPRAVASFGGARTGHWLYVYGGHVGRAHRHSQQNLSSEFWRWNLLDRSSWERLPSGPGLQGLALVSHGSEVYRLGGMSAKNEGGQPEDLWSVDDVAKFDPRQRCWIDLPPLPEPRSSFDACVAGNRIFVAGGWTLAGPKRSWLTTAYVLDLSGEPLRWEALPTVPFKRRAVDLTYAAGRIYVLGGITPQGKLSHAVDFFDLEEGVWKSAPELPSNGFGVSADALGDKVVASTMDGRVHRLRPGAVRWETIDRLHLGRFFHRALTLSPREMLFVGGAASGGHSRWIESLDPERDPTQPRTTRARIPYPGAGKNRQGMILDQNVLTFFGGNNSLGQHDFEPENFLSESFRLRLPSFRVEECASFPRARQSLVTLRLGDVGYAFGGFGRDGEVARAHAEIHRLQDSEWTPVEARLPRPRTQFGVAEYAGHVWVFGGLDYHPGRESAFEYPTALLKWDGQSPDFEEVSVPLTTPRRAFGGARLGDRYYLVGGMRQGFETVDHCEAFSFDTQQWSEIPSPRRPRISPELVAFDGKLYLASGSSPLAEGRFEPNRSLEVFDPGSNEWHTLIDVLPLETRHLRLFALDHCLLLISTHSEEDGVLDVYFLDPGRDPAPASRPLTF